MINLFVENKYSKLKKLRTKKKENRILWQGKRHNRLSVIRSGLWPEYFAVVVFIPNFIIRKE